MPLAPVISPKVFPQHDDQRNRTGRRPWHLGEDFVLDCDHAHADRVRFLGILVNLRIENVVSGLEHNHRVGKGNNLGAHDRASSATTAAADNCRSRAACANCASSLRHPSTSSKLSTSVQRRSSSSFSGSFSFPSERAIVTSSSLLFSITARASRRVTPKFCVDSPHFGWLSDSRLPSRSSSDKGSNSTAACSSTSVASSICWSPP